MLSFFLVAIGLGIVVLLLWIDSHLRTKQLTAMLNQLYRGDLTATYDFHFLDTRPEQLFFPFSASDLRDIASCPEILRHDLVIELMHKKQAFWGNFYYHISCNFEGRNMQGEVFSIRRDGYLYINCNAVRGHWNPCIELIVAKKKPFII